MRKIHPLSLESEAKVHAKTIERSVNDAVSKIETVEDYKRKYNLSQERSEKVHAKSIETKLTEELKIKSRKCPLKFKYWLSVIVSEEEYK